jgi:hypothetical protein
MKPSNPKLRNARPLPPPCGWCGRQLRRGYCAFCSANILLEIHMKRIRDYEENVKRISLLKLWLALGEASRYLNGFDSTAIKHAIEVAEARPVRGVQADKKEEAAHE